MGHFLLYISLFKSVTFDPAFVANGAATIAKWLRHSWQMAPPPLANGAATIGKWRRIPLQMA
jgi:hypothetical protein